MATVLTEQNQRKLCNLTMAHLEPQNVGALHGLIPLSKWVITPVRSGLTLLIPYITGLFPDLLSGMSHQVVIAINNSKIFPLTLYSYSH